PPLFSFSSRRRHTRFSRDWSSDVCSSDLALALFEHDKQGYAKARDAVLAFNPNDGQFFSYLSDLLGFLHLYPEADAVLVEGAKRSEERRVGKEWSPRWARARQMSVGVAIV